MILQDIIQKNKLSTFLAIKNHFSEEPYNLTVKSTEELYLLHTTSKSRLEKEVVRDCRSVILEKKTNKVVSYSLTHKIPYTHFSEKYPELETVLVEEAIDGTLINVFYTTKWHISTRGKIEAETSYWDSTKSFQTLFLEALDYHKIKLETLKTHICYSFVLAHPENRIVTKYINPTVYLVQARNIETLEILDKHSTLFSEFQRPKKRIFNTYTDLESFTNRLSYKKEGFVLYSKNFSERTKIQGPSYLKAKEMKGNNYCLNYRFVEIIQQNLQSDYLKYFKDHKYILSYYELHLDHLLNNLFTYYIETKVHKKFIEYPFHIKPLIYELHGLYIKKYKTWIFLEQPDTPKPSMTSVDVSDYIYSLPTNRLYFIIKKQIKASIGEVKGI